MGRDGRIRTDDFLLPKQARYQAALHPVASSLPMDDRSEGLGPKLKAKRP